MRILVRRGISSRMHFIVWIAVAIFCKILLISLSNVKLMSILTPRNLTVSVKLT